jgi:hypothetical protein
MTMIATESSFPQCIHGRGQARLAMERIGIEPMISESEDSNPDGRS